jgi:hypothetical protein
MSLRPAVIPTQRQHVRRQVTRKRSPHERNRPSEQQSRFLVLLSHGLTIVEAARIVGADHGVVTSWRTCTGFASAMDDAQAAGLEQIEDIVRMHARMDWRAALTILMLRRPERWGDDLVRLGHDERVNVLTGILAKTPARTGAPS